MDGTTLTILLLAVAAVVPAALVHELARATAALVLTRGRVCVLLGAGGARWTLGAGRLTIGVTARPWWGGECLHAPASRRRAAAVLLSGPIVADLMAAAALTAALRWPGATTDHPLLQVALVVFALVALTRCFADLVAAAGDRLSRLPRRAPVRADEAVPAA